MDDLYVGFGADTRVYGNGHTGEIDIIRRQAAQAHLKLIDSRVRHMGTEKAYDIYSRIQQELEGLGVQMIFDTAVQDLVIEDLAGGEKKATGVILPDKSLLYADHIVVAIGREGSEWLNQHVPQVQHSLQARTGGHRLPY